MRAGNSSSRLLSVMAMAALRLPVRLDRSSPASTLPRRLLFFVCTHSASAVLLTLTELVYITDSRFLVSLRRRSYLAKDSDQLILFRKKKQ
jgi:hypothetical protein